MPCYNAAKYLDESVQSIIHQTLSDWELVIVNDGSTDNSGEVAQQLANANKRIRVVSKSNGGYVSARIHGYKLTDSNSRYIIFYDADDRLHPEMLATLSAEMEADDSVGAAYCDHIIMDENSVISNQGIDMPRFVPTAFWVKKLDNSVKETPFISIFCWTKMIEPMTLIRRAAYDQTPGWDPSFGKGQGNIGEGVYLFAEIALQWKIHYINKPLYYYRRHSTQMSAIPHDKMVEAAQKVIGKWQERIKSENKFANKINAAIIFSRFRLSAKQRIGSMPHQIRYTPFLAVKSMCMLLVDYIRSLPLILSYRRIKA
jgi:glycosyltransferase involved in cell wall biosynthesis